MLVGSAQFEDSLLDALCTMQNIVRILSKEPDSPVVSHHRYGELPMKILKV